MSDQIHIRNIVVTTDEINRTISGMVGDFEIWFRMPRTYPLVLRSEPFVAVALLEAMYTGQDIVIDDSAPISKRLLENLEELQSVFCCWNEELSKVHILASITNHTDEGLAVGSFFSGGVDSSYTLYNHMDELTHLIMVDAFDDAVSQEQWNMYVEKQEKFSRTIDKQLIPIQTNVRAYAEERKISWSFMHGLVLSSLGTILGISKIYIPSSFTYRDLFPWGSHPITDPMWSTENFRVIHDAAGITRWGKVQELVGNQLILDNLHVCWKNKLENCGECPKCIRTMVSLYLLDITCAALPVYKSKRQLKILRAIDDHEAYNLEDALKAAKSSRHRAVYRKLYWEYKLYNLLMLTESIDRLLLGGTIRKLYRLFKKPKWLEYRVTLGKK